MSRRGENIYKRKDGRWEGRYVRRVDTISGEKFWGSVYSREYQDCKRRLYLAQAEAVFIGEGGHEWPFGEWVESWLEERKATLNHSTYVTYRSQIRRHIKPGLGHWTLSQVTSDVIQRYINEKLAAGRLDGGGGLSAATVQIQRHIISAAMEEARRRRLVEEKPVASIRKERDMEQVVPAYSMEEQFRLTTRLKELSCKNPNYLGPLLSLYTGLRVGELSALQWGDISFEEGLIRVRRTLQRIENVERAPGDPKTCIVLGPPKSPNAVRLLPLTREMMGLFRAYRDGLPVECQSKDCFLFRSRGKCVEPRSFERYHERAAQTAGVPKLKFHALRHTFATRAIESGMDIKALSELLGHSNTQITLNIYVHSLLDHKRKAMELFQKYISAECSA